MPTLRLRIACLLLLVALPTAARAAEPPKDAFAYNRLLGRGVNLGNALDAPSEGEWGLTLKAEYFQKIRKAGFNSVRIPIRWSAHAAMQAPYKINETFFKRIDWAIDQALTNQLVAVINMHHYEELFTHPDKHQERFLALWKQIAERYQGLSDRVYFELLNEPHDKLDATRWNELLRLGLKAVRPSNPQRIVVLGPTEWNAIGQLDSLDLPEQDRWLIATIHYYSPFEFTHQGASWMPEAEKWLGRAWPRDADEQQAVVHDFERAAKWGRLHKRPIYLGEFGTFERADLESRVEWTAFVRRTAEEHQFSWAYWEFGSGFGVFDPRLDHWRESLLAALIPPK